MAEEVFFKIYQLRKILKHSNLDLMDGFMDLYEYLQATKEDATYSPEDKLKWIFDVFDKDGNGTIDYQEMGDIIISLFNMSGVKVEEKKLMAQLQDMLKNLDKDDNEEFIRDEFIRNAVSCFFISDLLNGNAFNRICSVPKFAAQDITVLANKIKLTKKEIISQYEDFISKHPSGAMNRNEFLSYFKQKDKESRTIADSMFKVFDKDNRGTMNFLEFMLAVHAGMMKSDEEKLNWIFDVFDKNGKGVIKGNDVDEVVAGLFRLVGIRIENSILAARMEDLLESVNGDLEEEITKENFIKNAMRCDFVSDIINDDVINGLSQL